MYILRLTFYIALPASYVPFQDFTQGTERREGVGVHLAFRIPSLNYSQHFSDKLIIKSYFYLYFILFILWSNLDFSVLLMYVT